MSPPATAKRLALRLGRGQLCPQLLHALRSRRPLRLHLWPNAATQVALTAITSSLWWFSSPDDMAKKIYRGPESCP